MAIEDSIRSTSRTYKRKMPILWWTKRASYLKFIGRELTSLAVAYFVVIILFLIRALSKGEDSYYNFIEFLKSPVMMLLSIITLGGLMFHSITWFNLAPKAMVIKLGKYRVPGFLIALSNYIGWVIISVVIVWLLV